MKHYLMLKFKLERSLSDNQIDYRDYLRVKRQVYYDREYLNKYGIMFLPIENIKYDYEVIKLEDKNKFELMRVSDIMQEISTVLKIV